jgi:protein-disulfide isomerase
MLVSVLLVLGCSAQAQSLKGIDTTGIGTKQSAFLLQFSQEARCPCAPARTMLSCMQDKSCPMASRILSRGADAIREGLGPQEVVEVMVKVYLADQKHQFDLSKTAKKGAAKPAVTIVEFADFECPHCAEMRDVLDGLVKAHPKQVAVYFKNFPLPHHRYAHPAARAVLAAQQQGRFWQMHDLLFLNQASLSDDKIVGFAKEIGLNMIRFKKDMESSAVYGQIEKEQAEGKKANLDSTPTIYINGKMYVDSKNPDKIAEHIRSLVTGKTPGAGKTPAKK